MKRGYILLFSALIMVLLSCRHQKEVPTGNVELNIEMPPLVAKTDSVDISEIPIKHEPHDTCLRVSVIPSKVKLPVDKQTVINLVIENRTDKMYYFERHEESDGIDSKGNRTFWGNCFGYEVEHLVGEKWEPLELAGHGKPGVAVDLIEYGVHQVNVNEEIVFWYTLFSPYYYKYPPGRYRIIVDFASSDIAPSERIWWPDKGWKDKKGVVFAEFELIR